MVTMRLPYYHYCLPKVAELDLARSPALNYLYQSKGIRIFTHLSCRGRITDIGSLDDPVDHHANISHVRVQNFDQRTVLRAPGEEEHCNLGCTETHLSQELNKAPPRFSLVIRSNFQTP